jgi:hypothetical protein
MIRAIFPIFFEKSWIEVEILRFGSVGDPDLLKRTFCMGWVTRAIRPTLTD